MIRQALRKGRDPIGGSLSLLIRVHFDRHGYAMQTPQGSALSHMTIRVKRHFQCLLTILVNNRIDRRINPLNTLKHLLCNFYTRHAPGFNCLAQLNRCALPQCLPHNSSFKTDHPA